jgi:hypothetical protein
MRSRTAVRVKSRTGVSLPEHFGGVQGDVMARQSFGGSEGEVSPELADVDAVVAGRAINTSREMG